MIHSLLSLRYLLLLAVCILAGSTAMGQLDYRQLTYQTRPADSIVPGLQLELFSNNFFKNNEYFGDLNVGYTLFGSQGIANLKYKPHPNISLSGGVYYRLDFGHEGFYKLAPYYRLQLAKNGYTVNFGHIDGHIHHRMLDPMLNPERFITRHLENGFQFKIEKSKLWADTWVDWERQQYPLSDYQEVITGGHSSVITLWSDARNKVTLPVQLLFHHLGGQIDSIDAPVITTTNAALGLDFRHEWTNKAYFLQAFSVNSYYLQYHAGGADDVFAFTDGYGVFSNLNLEFMYGLRLNIGHWYGNQFYAPTGGSLFQSLSLNPLQPDAAEAERHLLFFGLAFQQMIWEHISADIRIQPFYDLLHRQTGTSYALFLNIQPGFLIKRFDKMGNR